MLVFITNSKKDIRITKFYKHFVADQNLDLLNISNEIIDKIVILHSYNFGSDLENLIGDNEKIGNSLINDKVIAGYYSEFYGKIVSEITEKQGELLNEGQDKFKKDK